MARHRPRGWPQDPQPLAVPVVDNHTHLDATGAVLPERSSQDPWAEGGHPTVADQVARARAAGVDRMVQVGCDLPSARWTNELLSGPPDGVSGALLGAVAIHPNEAVLHAGVVEPSPDGYVHRPAERHLTHGLDDALGEIATIARANSRIRAIGETGMDLFRTGERGAGVQRESFRAHIAMAKELDLAMQIHDRDAHREVLAILESDGAPARTVFHCFSGDAEMAQHCAARGWYLSFAGPVTYPANDGLRAALAQTPIDRVLVETDAPYLPPHPFRGRPNAPYVAAYTVRVMARVLGCSDVKLGAQISRNSTELYGSW